MTIAWNAFTPWTALLGGLLIGLAAALFVLLNGRIAGISGIVGGLLKPSRGDLAWRPSFVAGLVGSPLFCALLARLPVPSWARASSPCTCCATCSVPVPFQGAADRLSDIAARRPGGAGHGRSRPTEK